MKPSGGRRAQGREPPGEAARPSRGGAERHVEEGFVTDESSLLSPGTAHVKIVGTFSRSRRHSGSIPAQSRIWEAEDRQTGPTAGSGDRAPLSSVWAGTTPAELPRRRRHGTFAASLRRRARTALCVPPPPGTAGLSATGASPGGRPLRARPAGRGPWRRGAHSGRMSGEPRRRAMPVGPRGGPSGAQHPGPRPGRSAASGVGSAEDAALVPPPCSQRHGPQGLSPGNR